VCKNNARRKPTRIGVTVLDEGNVKKRKSVYKRYLELRPSD